MLKGSFAHDDIDLKAPRQSCFSEHEDAEAEGKEDMSSEFASKFKASQSSDSLTSTSSFWSHASRDRRDNNVAPCRSTARLTPWRICAWMVGAGTSCGVSMDSCLPKPPPTAAAISRWATQKSCALSTAHGSRPRAAAADRVKKRQSKLRLV